MTRKRKAASNPVESSDDEVEDSVDDDEIMDKGELVVKASVKAWEWNHFKVWSKLPRIANCSVCSMDVKLIPS